MCHIVTHRWSHRQSHGPPFEKGPVAAPRSFHGRGHRSPGPLRWGVARRSRHRPFAAVLTRPRGRNRGRSRRAGAARSRRSTITATRDVRRGSPLARPHRELHYGAASGSPQFHSRNRGTFSCTPRTCWSRPDGISAAKLAFAGVSSKGHRTERPPPCCNEIATDGTANFTYTYEVR
jgi:hypothetical protein